MAGTTTTAGAGGSSGSSANAAFKKQLNKVYGFYTGGFILFVVLLAIFEQMGLNRDWIGFIFLMATIALYAGIGIMSRTTDAAEYYVATTGSDSNSGAMAQPFATLQKAIGVVAAVDEVIDARDLEIKHRAFDGGERIGNVMLRPAIDLADEGQRQMHVVRRHPVGVGNPFLQRRQSIGNVVRHGKGNEQAGHGAHTDVVSDTSSVHCDSGV